MKHLNLISIIFFSAAINVNVAAQSVLPVNLKSLHPSKENMGWTEKRTIGISLKDIVLTKERKARIRIYVKGGEMAELSETNLLPGQDYLTINFALKNNNYSGIGEVLIDSLGAFPIVINNKQTHLELEVTKENFTRYAPPSSDEELTALALFLKIYKGYEAMFRFHSDKLVSPFGMFSSDTAAFAGFLTDYISFRKQFKLLFEYLNNEYSGTFVTEHLYSMFVQPSFNSLDEARDLYFSNWNFGDSAMLNTPLFDRQLDLYRFIASFPSINDDNKTTDGLFGFAKKYFWGTKLITDHINEYWIVNLFKNNSKGQQDDAIAHFYQQWLSNDVDACNEESGGETVFRNAFLKRLGNISSMQEGMTFPDVYGFSPAGNKISLSQKLSESRYTLFFVWSSTCSHCEEYAPLLQQLAEKHKDKVQVLAYSIDKAATKEQWLNKTKERHNAGRWTDIAEVNDMSSPGISKICYMGTPSVFLVDNQAKIILKDHNLQNIEKLITQ